jgi:hypothetical protein
MPVGAQPGARGGKRVYRVLAAVAVIIVGLLFVLYVVRALHGHDLSVYATPRAALGIVLAAIMWSCIAPLMALAWRHLLLGLGVCESRRELFGIIGITQLAKYVPGNVGQYVGRVGMSLAHGLPARALAATLVIETLLMIASAVIIGVGAGAFSRFGTEVVRRYAPQLWLIALLAALAVAGLWGCRRMASILLQRFAPQHAPMLSGALSPRLPALSAAFALYCVMYVGMGVGLILLASMMLPRTPLDPWLLISACALAWVVGFVTPGAPGGLGVREALLVVMLAPIFTAASASILVIALRMATILADVFCFGAGWLLLPKRKHISAKTA